MGDTASLLPLPCSQAELGEGGPYHMVWMEMGLKIRLCPPEVTLKPLQGTRRGQVLRDPPAAQATLGSLPSEQVQTTQASNETHFRRPEGGTGVRALDSQE